MAHVSAAQLTCILYRRPEQISWVHRLIKGTKNVRCSGKLRPGQRLPKSLAGTDEHGSTGQANARQSRLGPAPYGWIGPKLDIAYSSAVHRARRRAILSRQRENVSLCRNVWLFPPCPTRQGFLLIWRS